MKHLNPVLLPLMFLPCAVFPQDLPGEGSGINFIFLVIIVVIAVLAVVAFLSYAYGVFSSIEIPKQNPPGDPRPEEDCSQCRRDREWYDRQPGWKQAAVIVWWLANRSACAAKGCS